MKNTTQLKKQFNSRSVFLLIFVATVTLTLIWAVTGTSQISQAQPSLNISVTNSTVPVVSSQSTPTATQEVSTAAPSPEMLIESHPTGTPPSQGVVITVTAQTEAADWPSELDEPNHFNVSDIHTGTYQRDNYADAMQFDLSTIAPGSVIDYAAIEIKGLDDQHLNPDSEWQINLLNTTVDGCWFDLTPEALQPAPGDVTVPLNENTAQLVPGELSRFTFSDEARQNLQNCLGNGSISLRIDGSNSTEGNPLTRHNEFDQQTVLTLITLPPVETEEENQAPPTSVYTIVTSTPTPHNIVTAAAVAAEATHLASEFGTATPVPDNWVTPIVINPQPTPANTATALFRHQEATAAAFLYGPATATPYNVWTATPEPTAVEVSFVEEPTPTPTLPPTQTPVYIPVAGQVATPWVPPPPTATPIPLNIPEEIIGKIAFFSN